MRKMYGHTHVYITLVRVDLYYVMKERKKERGMAIPILNISSLLRGDVL